MCEHIQVFIRIIITLLASLLQICQPLQTNVVLPQGPVAGLKIFPESSRNAVYAFLGLPYAQPPVGKLRFAPPQPHTGWNWTLQAMSMMPICPQLSNTIYDESTDGPLARTALMDEDCLYLNIWVPETGMRSGSLPVLVIITGEEMAFDWPRNRVTGIDMASEGVIVINIQYRTNVFGWISLENQELSGNYGLKDQELALRWVQRNIQHFGGNPSQITVLGHGTSGAPCATAHLLTLSNADKLFSKLVLMSGGDIESALNARSVILESSKVIVQKLGCHFEERRNQLATCLRMKSVSDLQKAFESIYDHGNGTLHLGPIVPTTLDNFVSNQTQLQLLPPILIGITSNEGAFLHEYWLDLAREGYKTLRTYVNYTMLPNVLRKSRMARVLPIATQLVDTLGWRYFSGEAADSVSHLLNAMQRLISESFYDTPFYHILELFSTVHINEATTSSIYAYIFEVSNSMDMRGKINLFGGASHSSDLPFLFGPNLFQQISRRRFSTEEERLCRKMRAAFVNFVKGGNPTPGRIADAWLPYTRERNFIFNLGETQTSSDDESISGIIGNQFRKAAIFNRNLQKIESLVQSERTHDGGLSRSNRNENNPYQLATTVLGAQSGGENRRTKSSYLTNQQDSGYAQHLKHVYGFWHVLLPQMAAYSMNDNYNDINDGLRQRYRLMEATADAIRYRRGFFAMLGLVAVLLGILGLCVYLLRRDPFHLPARSSSFCL